MRSLPRLLTAALGLYLLAAAPLALACELAVAQSAARAGHCAAPCGTAAICSSGRALHAAAVQRRSADVAAAQAPETLPPQLPGMAAPIQPRAPRARPTAPVALRSPPAAASLFSQGVLLRV
jgi:hypothetical protein